MFYIYSYLDTTSVPFYIGKGQKDRYSVAKKLYKSNRNKLLKAKILKIGVDNVTVTFLNNNLTEEQAFMWEKYWIKFIGRRDQNKGPLCNMTDGGQGISGLPRSEEVKRKISTGQMGKYVSPKTREKLSIAHFGQIAWNKGIPTPGHIKAKLRKPHKGNGPNKGKKFSISVRSKLCLSHATLTEDQVRQIRSMYQTGISQKEIACTFNIPVQRVSGIVRYKHFKYVV